MGGEHIRSTCYSEKPTACTLTNDATTSHEGVHGRRCDGLKRAGGAREAGSAITG